MEKDFTVLELGELKEKKVPFKQIIMEPPKKVGVPLRPHRLNISTTLLQDRQTGEIYLDPFKRHAKPYWLTTEPDIITLPGETGSVTNPVSTPIPMPIDHQGPLEIDYSFFKSDYDFTINIFDPFNRPTLMNREIHIRTIASGFNTGGLPGAAGRPFIWPDPWFMATEIGKRNFMVNFRNLSDRENDVRFVLHGRRFYHQSAPDNVVQRYEDYYKNRPVTQPYFYTTDRNIEVASGTAAGVTVDYDIRITDDADVVIFKMTSVQGEPYEFKLIEKSTNRDLMNAFVRVENGFGDGEFPFLLFEPMYFEAGTKLILRIRTVQQAQSTYNIWPTFTVQKIFRARRKQPLGKR